MFNPGPFSSQPLLVYWRVVYQFIRPFFTVQVLAPSIHPRWFEIASFLKLPSSQYHLKEMRLVWLVEPFVGTLETQKKER